MPTIQEIVSILEDFAPLELAEEWDNVGLLVGDRERSVRKLMTCLTITNATADEAVDQGVDLIVTHHPLPFQPLRQITSDTHEGRMLMQLIAAGVAVYSPHTAFDSARAGINQHLATALGLIEIEPLIPAKDLDAELGTGRIGLLPGPHTLHDVVHRLRTALPIETIYVVGEDEQAVERVAVACGAGGSMLDAAVESGCNCFITGETGFHTCLAAESAGVAVVLTGHYSSERFALDVLAEYLAEQMSDVEVWASRDEHDPLRRA